MDSLLRLLMGPWTTYILWVLHSNGPTRFGELKRRVSGISAKMLTERLRMLEDSGVVHRDHQPTVPPQVTYRLTARGQELRQVLDDLSALARRWQATDGLAADRAAAAEESPGPSPALGHSAALRAHDAARDIARDTPRDTPRGAEVRRPMVPAAE